MTGVRVANLTHGFDGREVFHGLDFAYEGGCLAVTGHNGSGKSTLMRMIAGLLTPASGEACLVRDGYSIPRDALRHEIGLVTPDLKLYTELSARENLRFLLTIRGGKSVEASAQAALEEMCLTERADDPVRELSSGLRQRAALAAAIAHNPSALLLDEPSSNLDAPGIRILRELIARRAHCGLVVIATNDPEEAALAESRLDLGEAR